MDASQSTFKYLISLDIFIFPISLYIITTHVSKSMTLHVCVICNYFWKSELFLYAQSKNVQYFKLTRDWNTDLVKSDWNSA